MSSSAANRWVVRGVGRESACGLFRLACDAVVVFPNLDFGLQKCVGALQAFLYGRSFDKGSRICDL